MPKKINNNETNLQHAIDRIKHGTEEFAHFALAWFMIFFAFKQPNMNLIFKENFSFAWTIYDNIII